MPISTTLTGNEIFCLAKKYLAPGDALFGNCVYSKGLIENISAGFRSKMGSEIAEITSLLENSRNTAFQRMIAKTDTPEKNKVSVIGIKSKILLHGAHLEFLSLGSSVSSENKDKKHFSTLANGKELFALLDAGYQPIRFVFGNIAYLSGENFAFTRQYKALSRGEVPEYSEIFRQTRHLALSRMIENAKAAGASAIHGIQTTCLSFHGISEMLMSGTAVKNRQALVVKAETMVTSDLTHIEMWNMTRLGYTPLRLLLDTSIYAVGFISHVKSFFKSLTCGEIHEVSILLEMAREKSLARLNAEAKLIGADTVIGVKTSVHALGNGFLEFLSVGTAVKKCADLNTESEILPCQVMMTEAESLSRYQITF